ncbi:DUF4136 domain-containing protein [Vibrio splendidus]|uniref:DUF4136 domain-containing protein n=1 Tax=Vibrio TaxID=662 RepID=UPI00037DFA39|nr:MULTISPECIES: DUF4136 domain-containing protein [Vibrio]MBO7912317.1 DUF4136 domain-containing protein [Vibrio sp. G41H]MBT9243270.1 DUF4136 domain-containing protein [Vibrio splendidus]MCF7492119.1 DUF4136 domain-containing protein [Vibrio sp. G-C-1]MDH5898031.1 DUF4136 domain-containing protein [Vibrio splendidus]MDH5904872.1 DUF4136 domain-containing protein [Vibrio splendidus]
MFRLRYLFFTLLLLLLGCASDVSTDYDSSVSFAGFKTYQYDEPKQSPLTLDAARIKKAVDEEMKFRGISFLESDAQLTVYYEILEESELLADGPTFSFGFGTGSINNAYGAGVSTPTRVKEKKYGKLSISIVETQSNDVIWRSISQRQLKETMDTEDRNEFILDQVKQMFEDYPVPSSNVE